MGKKMKPWKGYVDVGEYDGVPHKMVFQTKRRLLNHRGNDGWRAIRVLVTEIGTPATDERIEKIRAIVLNNDISDKQAIEELRELLDAKPGRKG